MDKQYTLAGQPAVVKAPRSMSIRWDAVAIEGASSFMVARAAAIGVCLQEPGKMRPKKSLRSCRQDLAEFGRLYADQLLEAGVTMRELSSLGGHCALLCSEGLVAEEDVVEAEGFSEAQPEASTS
jgi:hypothetical protein